MKISKKITGAVLLSVLSFSTCAQAQDSQTPTKAVEATSDHPIIRLWPIERVGGEANRLKEVYRDRRGRKQLCGILDPNLTAYPIKSDKPTSAIIYCPGGAYSVLGLPTDEQLKGLNDLGISVFVLKYTIPKQPDAALQDLQRAIRLVRHQAKKWNIDPDSIGVMANSAGGHLSNRLIHNPGDVYEHFDEADKASCLPNFAVLQCSAYFNGNPVGEEFDHKLFHFKNKVPPTFLTYSKDDKHCPGGITYAKLLKEAGGDIHLKLYEKGGHGMSNCDWFSEASTWLKAKKIVNP